MTSSPSHKLQYPTATTGASVIPPETIPSSALRQRVGDWLKTIDCDTNERSKEPLSTQLGKRKRSSSLPLTSAWDLRRSRLIRLSPSPPHSRKGEPVQDFAMAANWAQAPATPAHTLSVNDPSTPTSQSSKARSNLSKQPDWIRRQLKQCGMIMTGRSVLQQKYPEFDRQIQDILQTDRHSAMKPMSVKKFSSHHKFFESANEDSLLVKLIPLLIKDSHLQKLDPSSKEYNILRKEIESTKEKGRSSEQEKEDEDILVSREWFDEGVTSVFNREFRGSPLLNIYNSDHSEVPLDKALSKGDGLSNPKPDYCWGFRPDVIDPDEPGDIRLSRDIMCLLQPAAPLEGPFFLIEGKGNQGNVLEAENQALRGGTALVNAARRLSEHISGIDAVTKQGADTESFVFSATFTVQCLDIYVHWAEVLYPTATDVGQVRTLWHMTFLKSYAHRDLDRLSELRQVLHNILQWGATERLKQLKLQRLRLYDSQRKNMTATTRATKGMRQSKRQKTDDVDGSPDEWGDA